MSRIRVLVLTCLALLGFAANSLLCRAALETRRLDPASFTTLRLAAGALALALLCRATLRSRPPRAGSLVSAGALFAYAMLFSIAYVRIPAGVGALVLFGAVQLTMIGWAIARGERPRRLEWIGLLIAVAGLVALKLPGLHAPDATGVELMAAAGVAWGVYSLRGRRTDAPLVATAGNFARSLPFALGASGVALVFSDFHLSLHGAFLAITSGAVTSGLCYSIWYAALPSMSATRAAIVQLLVPVLAALGGVVLLGEALTLQLVLSGAAILGGVALAVAGRKR